MNKENLKRATIILGTTFKYITKSAVKATIEFNKLIKILSDEEKTLSDEEKTNKTK